MGHGRMGCNGHEEGIKGVDLGCVLSRVTGRNEVLKPKYYYIAADLF